MPFTNRKILNYSALLMMLVLCGMKGNTQSNIVTLEPLQLSNKFKSFIGDYEMDYEENGITYRIRVTVNVKPGTGTEASSLIIIEHTSGRRIYGNGQVELLGLDGEQYVKTEHGVTTRHSGSGNDREFTFTKKITKGTFFPTEVIEHDEIELKRKGPNEPVILEIRSQRSTYKRNITGWEDWGEQGRDNFEIKTELTKISDTPTPFDEIDYYKVHPALANLLHAKPGLEKKWRSLGIGELFKAGVLLDFEKCREALRKKKN